MTEFGWCDSRQISIFVISNQFNKLFSSFMAASCNRAYIRSLQRSTHQLMTMIVILINIVIATMVISWVAPSLSPSSVTREAARATANCWQGGLGGWMGVRGGVTNIYYSAPIDVFWTTVNNQIFVEKVPIKSPLVLNVGFIQPRFS